ncbi:MAG TPA: hypothetical protein VF781_09025 [Solirubrobacteraceae bacterium]
MKIRKTVMVLAAMCASLLAVPVAASAATAPTTTATSFRNIPITGKAHNGPAFKGQFTVTRFVTRSGRTYALGTLTGKLGSRAIKREVALPAALPGSTSGMMRANVTGTCPVLHLTLGPLDLNLLGLTVHLNQVVLNIDAQSGPGNLLGNLLCSLSNLLNQGSPLAGTLTGALTGLLNIVQQLVNNPALLQL